jgi:hypothetical protein
MIERVKAQLRAWNGYFEAHGIRIVILGDDRMFYDQEIGKYVIPCIHAGSELDCYSHVPKKGLEGYSILLQQDWDMMFQIDDDTFLVPESTEKFLTANESEMFVGNPTLHPKPEFVSRTDIPFFSMDGGSGMLISRNAMEIGWDQITRISSFYTPWFDVAVASGLFESGVTGKFNKTLHKYNIPGLLQKGYKNSLHYVAPCQHKRYLDMYRKNNYPFTIINYSTGWGDIGLNGWLGWEDSKVNTKHKGIIISAHSDSTIDIIFDKPLIVYGTFAESAWDSAETEFSLVFKNQKNIDFGTAKKVKKHFPSLFHKGPVAK